MIKINARIKPIEGFPDYFIYDDGRVFSTKMGGRFLKPLNGGGGYLHVSLHNATGQKTTKIHRLVAEHFVSGRGLDLEVCHNDSNKMNNRACNLRWDTRRGNHADKIENGSAPRNSVMNNNHHAQKLSPEDVLKIVNLLKETKLSQRAIGKRFGVDGQAISEVNGGRNWSHYTSGELGLTYPIRNGRPHLKLSPEKVLKIVNLLKETKLSYVVLGKRFGVAMQTIGRINTGERWSNYTSGELGLTYPIRNERNGCDNLVDVGATC